MELKQIYVGNSLRNFNYFIMYGGNKAVIIDPFDEGKIDEFIHENNLIPLSVVNTHEHFDHIKGNDLLVDKYDTELCVPDNINDKIDGGTSFLTHDYTLKFEEGNYIQVKNTPGHTFSHISLFIYLNEELDSIITGDAFLNAGIGNCYSGDPKLAYKTIKDIFRSLPGNVKIYPGHDYMINNLKFTLYVEPSNKYAQGLLEKAKNSNPGDIITDMDTERQINTFLRLNEQTVVDGIVERFGLKHIPDEEEVFLKLRQLRDEW